MKIPICQHVLTTGRQCGSPAMEHGIWCYFHQNLHHRHRSYRYTDRTRGYVTGSRGIELPAIEDAESVQVALSCTINALATSTIDTKRAMALFYGLHLAGQNATRLKSRPTLGVVRDVGTTADGLDIAVSNFTLEEPEDGYEPKALPA